MKAAVLTEWETIEIRDVPIPELEENECLIKVSYTGICGTDLHIYGGHTRRQNSRSFSAMSLLVPSNEFALTVPSI